MKPLTIYHIDAFTDTLFSGNPAAIIPLDAWLDDSTMQSIAAENNLSETAFFVKNGSEYEIRWFTPAIEVNLCGHATLASAHVLFHHLDAKEDRIHFRSKSGLLSVRRTKELLFLDFPADPVRSIPLSDEIEKLISTEVLEAYRGKEDLMLVLASKEDVQTAVPDFFTMGNMEARGVIITAPGIQSDFVSRFFAPRAGIPEDPVTGSSFTMLTPFWSERLNKNTLKAIQLSARTGSIWTEAMGERVEIGGKAVTYMTGEIYLEGI